MHPITIFVLFMACISIFILPRRFVVVPILLVGIIIPPSQSIVISGLDLMVMRILILFGWLRLLFRSEFNINKLNGIDKALILYVFFGIITYILLWKSVNSFINRMGWAYNILGMYFLIKSYIKDFDDIDRIIKLLFFISVGISFFIIIEYVAHRNFFSIFGKVPKTPFIRHGRLRCQGPFLHPITAGCFGAFTLPLFFSFLWRNGKNSKLSLVGIVTATIITVMSSSSTPILSYLAAVVGICMWIFRENIRIIKWGVLFMLLGLHMVMQGPVWSLIDRIGLFVGSSSYHRYLLVDQFIKRFNEWWLIGTKSTAHWAYFIEVQLWDTSNQFINTGVEGGVISFILFISVIVLSFQKIGKSLNIWKSQLDNQKLFWLLGVSLFTYNVAFLGVALWDQTIYIWYFLIAMISSICDFSEKFKKQASSFGE